MPWFRRKGPNEGDASDGQAVYTDLRQRALVATPAQAGLAADDQEAFAVYGALLEWQLDRGIATVFVLADGHASLYLSTGGGVIGGGFHESVRAAVQTFLHSFEPYVPQMSPDPVGELPPPEMTDLRALTVHGRLMVRAPTNDLGHGRHPMSQVFHAGQAVITALRITTESNPDFNRS